MIEEQLAPRGILDPDVLRVFSKVERHRFLPDDLRENAYADYPLPVGEGQTISQPYMVALMTEALGLSGAERVLEIGTGSGYQAAILAELAKELYTIERLEKLSRASEELLLSLGYKNIHFKSADGTLGWPEEAPFDRVIITAASSIIPSPLTDQLKDGGKLLIPLGESFAQTLTLVTKKGNRLESENICGCVFVPLIGKYSKG